MVTNVINTKCIGLLGTGQYLQILDSIVIEGYFFVVTPKTIPISLWFPAAVFRVKLNNNFSLLLFFFFIYFSSLSSFCSCYYYCCCCFCA